jgi:CBS domain-containing protein
MISVLKLQLGSLYASQHTCLWNLAVATNAHQELDSSLTSPLRRPHAFTNLFHVIEHGLTEYKHVLTVKSEVPALDAIRLLTEHRYSQVPVVVRNQVAGLFSYRSFSLAVVNAFDSPGRDRADELSVWECIETPAYVQGTDEFHRLLTDLDCRDAVLIGSPSRCDGIITAMGVLRYLFEAASPFLHVAEIELSLRAIIEFKVGREELPSLASTCLTHYTPEKIPSVLAGMTFNDYVMIIGHGDHWDRFSPIFKGDRVRTRARLEQARDLRNDVFHLRRLSAKDHDSLDELRKWMLRLMNAAEAEENEWT